MGFVSTGTPNVRSSSQPPIMAVAASDSVSGWISNSLAIVASGSVASGCLVSLTDRRCSVGRPTLPLCLTQPACVSPGRAKKSKPSYFVVRGRPINNRRRVSAIVTEKMLPRDLHLEMNHIERTHGVNMSSAPELKATLTLPQTAFPMKANLPQNEPHRLARWAEMGLYEELRKTGEARRKAGGSYFLLHDGPPYANGPIHLGHALNKGLKDFVVKSKTMAGFDVPFVPG